MAEETIQVLMAGYLSKTAADEDAASITASNASIVGLAVVSKDLEGRVQVEERDSAVRTGAIKFGAAGALVGLLAPPLLATTAIAAALGAGVGKLVQRKVSGGIKEQAQDSVPIGAAGLLVAYPPEAAAEVAAAVKRAVTRATGEGTGSRSEALKAAVAEAQRGASTGS